MIMRFDSILNISTYFLTDGITAARLWRKLERRYNPVFCGDPVFNKTRNYAIEVRDDETLHVIAGTTFTRLYADDVVMVRRLKMHFSA